MGTVFTSDDELPRLYEAVKEQLDVTDPDDMIVVTVQHLERPTARSAWYVAGYIQGRLQADDINGYEVTPEIANLETDFVVCAHIPA